MEQTLYKRLYLENTLKLLQNNNKKTNVLGENRVQSILAIYDTYFP